MGSSFLGVHIEYLRTHIFLLHLLFTLFESIVVDQNLSYMTNYYFLGLGVLRMELTPQSGLQLHGLLHDGIFGEVPARLLFDRNPGRHRSEQVGRNLDLAALVAGYGNPVLDDVREGTALNLDLVGRQNDVIREEHALVLWKVSTHYKRIMVLTVFLRVIRTVVFSELSNSNFWSCWLKLIHRPVKQLLNLQ